MSKATKKVSQNKQNSRVLMGGALVVVLLLLVGIFIWRQSTTNSVPRISPAQYEQQFGATGATHVLIDVRTPDEFATGHIAGAINISVQSLPDRLREVPHDKPVVVYCHSGNRSAQAASILSKAGYTNIYDMGGILAWTAAGLPTVQ